MARHSFIQIQKLTDVNGRINYISSRERQENLYATYQTAAPDFWEELAMESQKEFQKNGTGGKCIEARELIIALPEQYIEYNPQEVLEQFTDEFKRRHKVECASALHHNKKMTNYHIHLIFSERQLLENPTVKKASRNMFYRKDGKRVRTKKEILDEEGNIKEGCYIISKGEIYEHQLFTCKNAYFKSKEFLKKEKHSYTELINQIIINPADKLQVFNSSGIYLPTKKVGKNNPKEAEILIDNKIRQEWNYSVEEALISGVGENQILQIKKEEITTKVKESIRRNGKRPGLFWFFVEQAVKYLKRFVEKWKAPPKPVLNIDMSEFRSMQYLKQQLEERLRVIQQSEKYILPRLEGKLNDAKGLFKGKERKEIQGDIAEERKRLSNMKQSLAAVVRGAGYHDVCSFMSVYNRAENEVLLYQRALEKYQKHSGESEPEKQSLKETLRKLAAESRTTENVKKRNRDTRGGR
ncbi:MobA/MobL family protein [Robinsoniella peoriensis]|uniref:MobA/MobL family protein n=1 Tax=Robinsoniella peoriensis TaxID=180332 RepID=UPI00085BF4AA|nr:MobA/MobL family protein [Robinsoniella peoriensis]